MESPTNQTVQQKQPEITATNVTDIEKTQELKKVNKRFQLLDIMLIVSFIAFVLSVGYFIQTSQFTSQSQAVPQQDQNIRLTPTPTTNNNLP